MPAQPLPIPTSGAGHQAANTQYYLQTLHDLIDMGTEIARKVHAQVMAQPTPVLDAAPSAAPDLTTAFDRIARAVRRTVLLAQRVAEPRPTPATASRALARRRILREVEDTIERRAFQSRTPIDKDALRAELHERLDSPDLDDDIANRPLQDVIIEIVRDLGIDFEPFGVCPARRRTPADIAAMCARAAAPIGAAPPTPPAPPEPASPQPAAQRPAPSVAPRPAPIMVPIPDDPPPDLAEMLALCANLVRDG